MSIVKSPTKSTQSARTVSEIYNNIKDGHTDLKPTYQRPSVWTQNQKTNLIYSLLHGISIPSITINDRQEANKDINAPYMEAVIDGKQRLEAIIDLLENRITIPAHWLHEEYITNPGAETITYDQLTPTAQRIIKQTPLNITKTTLKTEQEEAQHYLRINTTGTEQTAENLNNAQIIANI